MLLIAFVCDVTVSFFFFKQKTAYEMRISDWSSDVCSSDLGTFAYLVECHKGAKQVRRGCCRLSAAVGLLTLDQRRQFVTCRVLQQRRQWQVDAMSIAQGREDPDRNQIGRAHV